MTLQVIKGNRIVARLYHGDRSLVEQLLREFLGGSGKAVNRLFANGHVTVNGLQVDLYLAS